MELCDSDRVSMTNRMFYNDVAYQLECLKKLCDELASKSQSARQTQLKALLRSQYPDYLPPADSCPVVIRFDSKEAPSFEFHLCPKPLPNGWPDFNGNHDVAFYSAKIYNILKKDIDREKGASERSVQVGGNHGGILTPASENNEPDQFFPDNAFDLTFSTTTSALDRSFVDAKLNANLVEAMPDNTQHLNTPFRSPHLAAAGASSNLNPELGSDGSVSTVSVKEEVIDSISSSIPDNQNKRKSRVVNLFLSEAQKRANRSAGEAGDKGAQENTKVLNNPELVDLATFESWGEAERLFYLAVPSTQCDKRLTCPLCSKSYDPSYLRGHINSVHKCHKPYSCTWDNCTYESKVKSAVAIHVRNRHLSPNNLANLDERQYIRYTTYID